MVSGPLFSGGGGGVGARADDILQQAAFALDGGRPQEAERIAAEVLKSNPNNARALFLAGSALIMQDRALEAVKPLEAAARGRHDAEFDTMLAIALRQVGRREDALSRLKLAAKRRPPYAPAFRELGYLLVLMERYDEAVQALARGIEIAPMMPQLHIQLGYAHLSRRDCANAKMAFARALEISPRSHDALFGMAKAYQEVGECEPAADYLRRSLQVNPNDQAAWLHLGHCLLELGQIDAGYNCFRTAARGEAKHYGNALMSFVAANRGRFWLKPSAAMRFLRGESPSASGTGTDGDKRQSHA
jgi:tetratricopeptide (TPR) repeat protein